MCSLERGSVISAPDVTNVYEVPLNFEKDGLTDFLLTKLDLRAKKHDLREWRQFVRKSNSPSKTVNVAMVGKYFGTGAFTLQDSYISVIEAIKHAAAQNRVKVNLTWVASLDIEQQGANIILSKYDGIVVPGGFGSRGTEGMVEAIKFARSKKVPYLGLCYGMQMATIEFARNVGKLKGANTTEVDPGTLHPVIHIMPNQEKKLLKREYGATMRLGAWDCLVVRGTKTERAYISSQWINKTGKTKISERHRHRYEFNNEYRDKLQKAGLIISGTSPDGKLVEIIELRNHPFFIATQFHPEFKSRPLEPHPLFSAFVRATK